MEYKDYMPEKRIGMISGQHEAQIRTYKNYIDKHGKIWLVANQPNSADNIYQEGGKNSDGFGGATLKFTLENGKVLKLKGPWHSNSEALFLNTGVDVRNKHLTFCVVALKLKHVNGRLFAIMKDVIYKDEKPTIGKFDRGREIAQQLANKLKQNVYLYKESAGGRSSSMITCEE